MKLLELTNHYKQHPNLAIVLENIKKKEQQKIHFKGLYTSASSLFFYAFQNKVNTTNLILLADKEEAAYFFNDLQNIDNSNNKFYLLSSSYKKDFSKLSDIKQSEEDIISRTKIIEKLIDRNSINIISYPEAIIEKEASVSEHKKQSFKINKGEKISTDFLKEFLLEAGFIQKEFVFSPNEFSIRGSIFDVFSFSNEFPFRIDFFGDEVETIRTFDIIKQLSIEQLNNINIHPNVNFISKSENKISFFEHLPKECTIWANNIKYTIDKIDLLNKSISEINKQADLVSLNQEDIINSSIFLEQINKFNIIEFCQTPFLKSDLKLDFKIVKQADFNKNFDLLSDDLKEKEKNLYKNYILSDNLKQIERLESILSSENIKNKISFTAIRPTIHEGFYDKDLKICCYTDHQIFKRYHRAKYSSQELFEKKSSISVLEINQLKPGDYVVHIDHGIGKFGGLQTIDVNGKQQETIRITYKNNDTLYVSIHSLHRISKYKGSEGTAPKIYKLGSGAWQKLKDKTKSKVKDIAKDLIVLYAKRKALKGFEFSPDTYLQQALEASFIYEDTPDQLKATIDTKADMESETPMDRLVCGDVGFGKTEIAIRAAFKAVTDGKQVAILVPTTILSLQHFQTFRKRLKNFPCNVEYISRLKNAKEQKRIIEELKSGKIDILIGTHRIISKDIVFKDLGLLIIDEEQKFGVALKEKLKQIKINVDTLTLTATPIPRTL
ncbi:MAG: DEAD/DEAH box helicase, partial [Bacteroidales bacterium]|nr:DEAD/DEAH box helicase [Bacteroidales bacterium]